MCQRKVGGMAACARPIGGMGLSRRHVYVSVAALFNSDALISDWRRFLRDKHNTVSTQGYVTNVTFCPRPGDTFGTV